MSCCVFDVLDRAVELRKEPKGHYGLCRTLGFCDLPEQLVRNISSSWEHFTGDMNYPVPNPAPPAGDVVKDARRAYSAAVDMYEGEYGALRIKLLDHVIAYLEGYLKDHG